MHSSQLKTLSKLQKAKIIDAIHNDDIDFLFVYFQDLTPYQLAEWSESSETPRYLKLYLYFFMDTFPEFSDIFRNACLTFWSSYEKEDAIQKGEIPAEGFLPKEFENFHKQYSSVLAGI